MSTSVNNNTQQFVTVFVPVQIPVSLANQFNLTENQVVPASAINTFFESDDNLCFESQVDTVMQCETCDTNTTATATTSGATDMVVTTECFVRNPMESSTTSFEMQSSSHHSCTMVEQEEEEIPEQEVFQEHNTTETTTTGETFNSFKSSVFGNSRTIESVRLCSPSLDARGGAAGDAASAARACANTNNNNNNVVNRFVVENNQQFEEHHSSSGSHSSSSSSSCLRSDQDCFDRDRVIDRSIIIGCSTIPNPCVPCLNSPAATISTAAVNNSVLHDCSNNNNNKNSNNNLSRSNLRRINLNKTTNGIILANAPIGTTTTQTSTPTTNLTSTHCSWSKGRSLMRQRSNSTGSITDSRRVQEMPQPWTDSSLRRSVSHQQKQLLKSSGVGPTWCVYGNSLNEEFFRNCLFDEQCGDIIVDHFEPIVQDPALFHLSAGGRRILDTPNAGGNSVWSEVLSYEVLHECFGAQLKKTETEIEYAPGSKITDYSVDFNGHHIGVSVVRIINFFDLMGKKYKAVFTPEYAKQLLYKKLFGVLASTEAVYDKWEKQILYIWTTSSHAADIIVEEYWKVPKKLRSNTLVYVTHATNSEFMGIPQQNMNEGGGGTVILDQPTSISIEFSVATTAPDQEDAVTPLPRMKLFAIFIIILCDGLTTYSIFPYINFMVKDYNLTDDEEKLGYFVGILASTFYISQFFSSFFWGWFSNIKGRRPALLLGIIGAMVTSILFGLSKYYYFAIIFRFVSGLLNGNVGVSKTMLGEITDSTNQKTGFTILGIAWGIGAIVAPLIGGLFSNVCINYPNIVHSGILCDFPYLLPNVICFLLNMIGLILCFIFLTETKSFEIKYSSIKKKKKRSFNTGAIINLRNSIRRLWNRNNQQKGIQLHDNDNEMDSSNHAHEANITTNRSAHAKTMKVNSSIGDFSEIMRNKDEEAGVDSNSDEDTTQFEDINIDEDFEENPRSVAMLFRDKPVMTSCIAYALLGFVYTIFEEVFPVWSPISKTIDSDGNVIGGGGLGFNSKDIGIIQSAAGFFALFVQLLVFAPLAKRFGLIKCFKAALLIALPSWILLPELTRLVKQYPDPTDPTKIITEHPPIFWVLLFPAYLFQSFANEVGFIAVIVIVSNSALPKDMALVNSISQSLVAFGRSIGPLLGTSVLSLSLSHSLPYPFDQHLIFVIIFLLTCVIFAMSFSLPQTLNHTKQKSIQLDHMNSNRTKSLNQ
ncbi:hypothetical protein PPL_09236 [Heterostelium album PN500]|uniref:Major facilitator superfamily (MFS) profile domain-containing protein n=1 Tax=Heterostelium pallidum (strain ATCC 26659 / Pp 5 / PN500) TaxID=670386 RepID=D3BL04_HETP5|nr:hypothetical protein PPL_09236 [Heterostelium album PN500]EFA78584.1 hypothetical protein PPL_09236 [Heterostelium album PN500]|eukprot:XP_020430708.1 hypothetical protein PPL_09236 [Heterostelium album PN500]